MKKPEPSRDRPEYQSRVEMRHTQSFPRFRTVEAAPKSRIERLLTFFADVRSGEGVSALLLLTNVFLLLFAYYLLKTIREALILTEADAYVKSYASAGQAVLLMLVVPAYGFVGTKVVRIKLLVGMLFFFIVNLALFSFFGANGANEGVVFYIWLGIFNVFVISQVWAFANDIYTEGQGKRLFPMIGIGASLGAWLGAQGAEALVTAFHTTPYQIQLLAAGVLLVCAGLLVAVSRIAARHSIPEMAKHAEQKLATGDGFVLIARDRYLLLIAVMIVILNVVNSTGEFLLSDLVAHRARAAFPADAAAQKEFIGGVYGGYFAAANLLGFLLQTFAAARLFALIGIRGALYVLPSISLVSYSTIGLVPILGFVRWAKIFENATDYSIQNTVQQALFLPTSREAKYKAKAAIDTFFKRFGDVLQAAIVRLGAQLHLNYAGFAWINVGLTLAWLYVVTRLSREHRRMRF